MSAVVLVVEDEAAIQELIAVTLGMAGYRVLRAASAEAAQQVMRDVLPDLLMVDWMLPEQSGLAFTRVLRADPRTRQLPIIMLTARASEQDAVMALENGVDDYITKPFSPRETLARIHAVLRRRAPHTVSDTITLEGLKLDPTNHRVTANGHEITLSPTEFRLLHYLMAQPGRVHSRGQLLDKAWTMNSFLEERTVDAYVGRLRNALEAVGQPARIETVRGIGYRFAVQTPAADVATPASPAA
jgi:two-component system phosphate regulon response regulator PhoB